MRNFWIVILNLWILNSSCQIIKGKVFDNQTLEPIPYGSVYINNTTIGTYTDSDGAFELDVTQANKNPLVVSFLGYKSQLISVDKIKNFIEIGLKENTETLQEVSVKYDDGLSRKFKEKLFTKELLGNTVFGQSCKIEGMEAVRLYYNNRKKEFRAIAKSPLKVINKKLRYIVTIELTDFSIIYNYSLLDNKFSIPFQVIYAGYFRFENTNIPFRNRIFKRRVEAYSGSVEHFFKSLYYDKLKEEGFKFFYKRRPVSKDSIIETLDKQPNRKKVVVKNNIQILDSKKRQSFLKTNKLPVIVDSLGNATPLFYIKFGGSMGKRRVGDLLPSNFNLNLKE